MNETPYVLIGEDDETDVLFIKRAFARAGIPNPLVFVPDGLAAIEHLSQVKSNADAQLPALFLIDMKMPRRNGLQVLQWMREQPVICAIPVLVFSSSAHTGDIENAYEAGANGFIIKPSSTAERNEIALFIRSWLRIIQPSLAATDSFKIALSYRNSRRSNEVLRKVEC
ncbi:MAG: response regulator [Opitutaceae bacterium]|nr:response regulator [Opitutaceae bacterium]